MYEWLAFSLLLVGVWLVIYVARRSLRKEMLWVSLFTSFTGFAEPLFVQAYWSPPSLFDLARRTGFDVESLIFSFAVGGIAAVLYEAVLNVKHRKMSVAEVRISRRWFHLASLASMPFVFFVLLIFTRVNPIYPLLIALFVGGIAAIACRPDLAKNTFVGGALFAGLYFAFFLVVNTLFPRFIDSWNLSVLSGILVLNVPLEELLYGFTFGMYWSTIYEHFMWYTFSPSSGRRQEKL
ncbi:MAG TPA: lycopene cyclase domain-containing protein [Candidatus Bathyarchaeia archaeon]|nr:lycopene cyclase domain-containing protein [Candidatus Bathyarchaeia archaeon]